jgi:hypothetical protein
VQIISSSNPKFYSSNFARHCPHYWPILSNYLKPGLISTPPYCWKMQRWRSRMSQWTYSDFVSESHCWITLKLLNWCILEGIRRNIFQVRLQFQLLHLLLNLLFRQLLRLLNLWSLRLFTWKAIEFGASLLVSLNVLLFFVLFNDFLFLFGWYSIIESNALEILDIDLFRPNFFLLLLLFRLVILSVYNFSSCYFNLFLFYRLLLDLVEEIVNRFLFRLNFLLLLTSQKLSINLISQ